MRIAIIGSRSITEEYYPFLDQFVPAMATEIVSGGATGADQLATRYAAEHDLKLTEFLPNYEEDGKRAPLMRNNRIVAYADYVLALWDGQSRGTSYTINRCIQSYVPIRVLPIRYLVNAK